jgi:hypothetical protein
VVPADPPAARSGDRSAASLAEQQRTAELERSVLGTASLLDKTLEQLRFLKRAIDETPGADSSLVRRVRAIEQRLLDARELLQGDPTRGRRNEASPPSLLARLTGAIGASWSSTLEPPSPAQLAQVEIVRAEFGQVLQQVRQLVEVDLKALETAAEAAGVPWTPGRLPRVP